MLSILKAPVYPVGFRILSNLSCGWTQGLSTPKISQLNLMLLGSQSQFSFFSSSAKKSSSSPKQPSKNSPPTPSKKPITPPTPSKNSTTAKKSIPATPAKKSITSSSSVKSTPSTSVAKTSSKPKVALKKKVATKVEIKKKKPQVDDKEKVQLQKARERERVKKEREKQQSLREKEKERSIVQKEKQKILDQKQKEKDAKEKKRAEKESRPKRPATAYMKWGRQAFSAIRKANPNLSSPQVIMEMGKRWSLLSASEKKPFEEEAKKDKQRYITEKAEYMKQLPPKRPMSAFFMYFKDIRATIKSDSVMDGARKAGVRWRNLSAAEKEKYFKMATKAREEYGKKYGSLEKK